MPRRGIRVAPACIPKIKQALRRHGFPSQNALAVTLGLSRATITSFFTGKAIDYTNFVEISERLGLDWQAIAYIEEEPPISLPLLNELDRLQPENLPENSLGIDWRQVCQEMLKAQNQQRLTTNPLTAGDGLTFELDEIYVPLGLVERKQRERRIGDISPDQGSRIYESETSDEITQTFQNNEFFEQILRPGKSKRIAIIGEPGAGKTTLLQKIAAWVIDNTSDVPIWISLADLQGKTIEEYLLSNWLKTATRKVRVTPEMEEILGELFNSRRVWLLLDGVDEMVTEPGNALAQISKQLTGWVSDARVVLTCRLNVWDAGKNALENFETYRNLDFSYGDAQTPDQVEQFIRCWFKHNPALAERLRTELDKSGRERIKDAVKNPLRLALLCRTWALGKGGLPNTKAGLYRQFVEALYEWKQEQFPTSSTQRQELNQALGELAKRAIAQEKTKFRLRHRLVCEILGEPDAKLFKLALQLGWLNQVGVAAEAESCGEKVYAFYHPTFQEYFAAQAINDWYYFLHHIPDNPKQGNYWIFEAQWKEVILLWLGREDVLKEQKEGFLEELVEFEDGYKGSFYKYRTYFLAAAGIAEFEDYSRADEIVAQIFKWSFDDVKIQQIETKKKRRFIKSIEKVARATLLETNRHKTIVALVELLKVTEDEYTWKQASEVLGKIGTGNQTAIQSLEQLIKVNQYKLLCQIAAESLGKIDPGNKTARKALIQLIKLTQQDELTQRQAAESLGQTDPGNQTAVRVLVQLIESTQSEYNRRLAAESLGKIDPGNSIAMRTLVQLSESSEDEATRKQAAESLEKIDPGNLTVIQALVKLIQSTQDKLICRQAAESLGKIDPGNQIAIQALIQLINSSEDALIRRQAAESLGKVESGNSTARRVLMQLFESAENEFTRWRVADSLGKIDPGNQVAIAALLQLIVSSENESARRQAAKSLKQILRDDQLPEVVATLRDYLSDQTYDNDFERVDAYYEVLWHCAQNMSYLDFYQAWHN